MEFHTVGVLGSGTMGSGIAQIIGQSGYRVLLYDIQESIAQQAVSQIGLRIDRLVEKGKLTHLDGDQVKKRIEPTVELADMKNCELIIEAVPEKLELKKRLFRQLGEYCPNETILATNTSSFSITELASATQNPGRIAGLHFFNPAYVMPLVEVVRGLLTESDIVKALVSFVSSIGKSPVICEDTPGFIVNRIARPFYNEALRILGDRVANVEQIDRIMRKAGKFRMGPFELQDMIGIDINFSTTESVHQAFFGDPRFRPHYYQQRMMQSGQLGRKTGGGYYAYDK
ncbi:3-hydroxyacyl-CoA dehydrogenase NAD-binding domain-containing protein [Ferviditalea candida]|uniref:3-hydroxyacyl-CoA dehydrogenase NAD-binding domain-containing protein n=1 Tax=Ferviditalea candida TaxID=3108399 RepID=A0ABU5ZCB1_9BACL|nr:3-hydroxyacyl-CoA dehydrogenase NAD-binding domain-containing protein [Paenibacillaceae bacterium T2]